MRRALMPIALLLAAAPTFANTVKEADVTVTCHVKTTVTIGSATPAAIDFGALTPGTPSLTKTSTVAFTANVPLAVTAAYSSAGPFRNTAWFSTDSGAVAVSAFARHTSDGTNAFGENSVDVSTRVTPIPGCPAGPKSDTITVTFSYNSSD